MPDIFDKVHGAKFPEVVMNSGPLPPMNGSLPAPLHDTPDGKINYNSTLFGDLQPYAYGEPGYLSSQNGYLNIPHRIQKIIPVIHLPEPSGETLFRLSHSVDDGDLAFCMRLNRSSMFCTGTKYSSRHHALGTNIDPLINLPTLNYILAGIQLNRIDNADAPLWLDLLHALDPMKFPERTNTNKRDYSYNQLDIRDIVHILRNCIRPFGIMRGSEKQGGQNEVSMAPSQWPVPFVGTFVVDGREEHIVNMWHSMEVDSGEDLVLRLKPMPVRRYTLNHYYKQPIHKGFSHIPNNHTVVWQLVPDKFYFDQDERFLEHVNNETLNMPLNWLCYPVHKRGKGIFNLPVTRMSWQELGYWHIGRTQLRMHEYVVEGGNYYHNDMVNALRSQYMLMTYQPVFAQIEPFLTDKSLQELERVFQIDYREHRKTLNSQVQTTNSRRLNIEHLLGMTPINNRDETTELGKRSVWEIVDLQGADTPENTTGTPLVQATTESRVVDGGGVVQADNHDGVGGVAVDNSTLPGGILKKAVPNKRKKMIPGSVIFTDGSTEHHSVQQL